MSVPVRSRYERIEWQELPSGEFHLPDAWCVALSGAGRTRAAGRPVGIRRALWLTLAVERPDASRGLVHVELRQDGALRDVVAEERGESAVLFEGPDRAPWAILRDRDADSGRLEELVAPVRDRDGMLPAERARPFGDQVFGAGERIGRIDVDPRPGHPDRWQVLSLRADGVRREPKVKLPPPQGHRVLWDGRDLHAWARDDEGRLVIRELSDRGSVLRERRVALDHHALAPARLSFDAPSVLLAADGRNLRWLELDPDDAVRERGAVSLPRRREALDLGRAQALADGAFVLRYETDGGDGWCVLRDGEPLEHFVREPADGYNELLSGRTLELPRAGWAAASITPQGRGYAVVLAPDGHGRPGDVQGVAVFGRVRPGAE